MPLTPGSRLGAYEIVAPIGAGGMGEVYRARDPKLNREVAIKVLPDQLSRDPVALSRFEREAQAVAALSHPNILAIHDFGSDRGITYAVTELLEGDTLKARLQQGPLTVRKAIDVGLHIVRGIAAAHGRGIVHRDLKPDNVFITKDNVVKILDFGLAKVAESPVTPDATQLEATTPGTVMGTVGYMSPEQVRGLPLDHRTDIFSFGAILYEMLTGRRAFRGDSHVETMNAILKEDPPEFSEVNPNLPSSLESVIRRCVEKEPGERFHSAHDLGFALEAVSGASTRGMAAVKGSAPALHRRRVSPVMIGAGLLAVALASFAAGHWLPARRAPAAPEYQRLTFRRGPVNSARLATDGTTVVYSAAWDGNPLQVFSTRAESPESLPLPYPNADIVAISSRGELAIVSERRTLRAFARPGTLARAQMSGGASRPILENVQDADWLPDGSTLAVSHVVDGRYRLEFPIGTVVYETGGWVSDVRVSPDGRTVAFLDHPILGDDRGFVAVVGRDGKARRLETGAEFESTQGLAWTRSGEEIWYTAADRGMTRALRAATMGGRDRIVARFPGNLLLCDLAADGTVLLVHNNARRGIVGLAPGEGKERDLSWLDWSQPLDLSDDGRTLLISEQGDGGGPGYSIYLRKTDGSPAVRLGGGDAQALSPDGKWVIAQRLEPAPAQFILLPTGAGEPRPLTNDDITHLTAVFLPDGKRFLFLGFKPGKPRRIWVQDLAGGTAKPVTPEGVTGLLVSPDGTRVGARDLAGQRSLYPIDGGAPQPLPKIEPDEGIVGFAADGGLFLRRKTEDGVVQVSRLDLASGTRTQIRQITPYRESLGAGGIGQLLITPDARSYVYGYGVTLSDLYLVKGLQ